MEKTVVRLSSDVYQRLVGRYRYQGDPGVGEFDILLESGHLFLKYPDAPKRELLAESESKLFDRVTGTDVEVQNGSSTLYVVGIGHAVKIP